MARPIDSVRRDKRSRRGRNFGPAGAGSNFLIEGERSRRPEIDRAGRLAWPARLFLLAAAAVLLLTAAQSAARADEAPRLAELPQTAVEEKKAGQPGDQGQKTSAKTDGAGTGAITGLRPTVKEILAIMAEREKSVRSFEFRWRARLTGGRGSDRTAAEAKARREADVGRPLVGDWPVNRLVIAEPKFRFETTSGVQDPCIEAFDGNVHQSYLLNTFSSQATAVLTRGPAPPVLSHVNLIALQVLYRPFWDEWDRIEPGAAWLEAGTSEANGRTCVVLRTRKARKGNTTDEWRYYLDPGRKFVPVRIQWERNAHPIVDVSIPEYTIDPKFGPVPTTWFTTLLDGSPQQYCNIVEEYHLNRNIPNSEFELQIPDGTEVIRNRRSIRNGPVLKE